MNQQGDEIKSKSNTMILWKHPFVKTYFRQRIKCHNSCIRTKFGCVSVKLPALHLAVIRRRSTSERPPE